MRAIREIEVNASPSRYTCNWLNFWMLDRAVNACTVELNESIKMCHFFGSILNLRISIFGNIFQGICKLGTVENANGQDLGSPEESQH